MEQNRPGLGPFDDGAPPPARCPSCEIVYVNGIKCHETGCRDAWRDEVRECRWCGNQFVPEEPHQTCCDTDCATAYAN